MNDQMLALRAARSKLSLRKIAVEKQIKELCGQIVLLADHRLVSDLAEIETGIIADMAGKLMITHAELIGITSRIDEIDGGLYGI